MTNFCILADINFIFIFSVFQPPSSPNGIAPMKEEDSSSLTSEGSRSHHEIKNAISNEEVTAENSVELPQGFEHVLEKASENVDSVSDRPSRRRSCRCETKVMSRAADGTPCTKFYDVDDLCDFAQHFKAFRLEHDFSQTDVGNALRLRYGTTISQTTISRFEGSNLSHTNMCILRPSFEQWLVDIKSALKNGIPANQLKRACNDVTFWPSLFHQLNTEATSLIFPRRSRKKRTNLDSSQRLALETYFEINARPKDSQIDDIANTLGLDYEVCVL